MLCTAVLLKDLTGGFLLEIGWNNSGKNSYPSTKWFGALLPFPICWAAVATSWMGQLSIVGLGKTFGKVDYTFQALAEVLELRSVFP